MQLEDIASIINTSEALAIAGELDVVFLIAPLFSD